MTEKTIVDFEPYQYGVEMIHHNFIIANCTIVGDSAHYNHCI